MTVRNLGDVIIYLGAVAVAVTSIGVLLRYLVVRPLKKWLIEQIRTPMRQVHAEVHPDHGHSMRDAITRTEVKVDMLAQRFDDHLTNHPGGSR